MIRGRARRRFVCVPAAFAALIWLAPLVADARVLDKVRVSRSGAEATVEIEFMCAMRYLGHRPAAAASLFMLELSPGNDCLVALRNTLSDVRRPASGHLARLAEIEFEHQRNGRATMTLRFASPVVVDVTQTANVHMLTLRVGDTAEPVTALPPPTPVEPAEVTKEQVPRRSDRVSRPVERPRPSRRNRFVIRAAVIDDIDDIDPGALEPARSHTAYTNSVVLGARRWTELRIGFFDTESEAQDMLQSLAKRFPSAWITVANPEEQGAASANAIPWRDAPANGETPLLLPETGDSSTGDTAAANASPVVIATPAGSGEPMTPEQQTTTFEHARAALLRSNYTTAIDLYVRLLGIPDGDREPEAREMLGVAFEKIDRPAQARAEYEAYLADFPDDRNAGRVRQRLAAVSPRDARNEDAPAAAPARASQPVRGASRDSWAVYGGLSQYYLRGVAVGDGSRPDIVAQSSLLTQSQLVARRRGERFDIEARSNLSLLYDFDDADSRESLYVSHAWIDVTDTKSDRYLRAGRQHQPRSGVIGRFDGLHLGFPWRRDIAVRLTAGLPVDSPRFRASGDRYFVAAGVDFENLADAWRISLFANEQIVDGISDRRAIGGEAHYQGERLNVFGLIDYDPSYNVLNNGLVTGTWRANDRLKLHGRWLGGAAPFISTRNALIGQSVRTVRELLASYSEAQIRRLARNRTADQRSGAVGMSAAITPRMQFNADFGFLEYSATIASGGIDAYPGTGPQYSWSTHVVGSGIVKPASTIIAGYRHDERRSIDDDSVWLDFRLPLGERVRLQTRLEASRRVADQNAAGDIVQWVGRPVVRLWYSGGRRYRIEFEVGGQWSNRDFPELLKPPGLVDAEAEQSSYYLQLGYQLDF